MTRSHSSARRRPTPLGRRGQAGCADPVPFAAIEAALSLVSETRLAVARPPVAEFLTTAATPVEHGRLVRGASGEAVRRVSGDPGRASGSGPLGWVSTALCRTHRMIALSAAPRLPALAMRPHHRVRRSVANLVSGIAVLRWRCLGCVRAAPGQDLRLSPLPWSFRPVPGACGAPTVTTGVEDQRGPVEDPTGPGPGAPCDRAP